MSTIHLLVIADTKCHQIGKTVQIDVDRILNQMREYSSLAGMWLNIRVLDGFHNQPDNIKKSIKELQIGIDDVIFLYYSGHGFRAATKKDPFPSFYYGQDIITGSVDGYDSRILYDTLRYKCPRLLIFMTDSCQEIVDGREIKDHAKYSSRRISNLPEQIANCTALFKDSTGEVLLVSCEPGEYSNGNGIIGGIFSHGLFDALETAITEGSKPEWSQIAKVGAETAALNNPNQNAIWKFTNRDVFSDLLSSDASTLDNWTFSRGNQTRSFPKSNPNKNVEVTFGKEAIRQNNERSFSSTNEPTTSETTRRSVLSTSRNRTKSSNEQFCINCGKGLRHGARFCVHCGTKQL